MTEEFYMKVLSRMDIRIGEIDRKLAELIELQKTFLPNYSNPSNEVNNVE